VLRSTTYFLGLNAEHNHRPRKTPAKFQSVDESDEEKEDKIAAISFGRKGLANLPRFNSISPEMNGGLFYVNQCKQNRNEYSRCVLFRMLNHGTQEHLCFGMDAYFYAHVGKADVNQEPELFAIPFEDIHKDENKLMSKRKVHRHSFFGESGGMPGVKAGGNIVVSLSDEKVDLNLLEKVDQNLVEKVGEKVDENMLEKVDQSMFEKVGGIHSESEPKDCDEAQNESGEKAEDVEMKDNSQKGGALSE